MSNLTLGLAILGGLILAAVVAHSAWTSRRNAPKQAEPQAAAGTGDAAGAPRHAASSSPAGPCPGALAPHAWR